MAQSKDNDLTWVQRAVDVSFSASFTLIASYLKDGIFIFNNIFNTAIIYFFTVLNKWMRLPPASFMPQLHYILDYLLKM